MKKLFYRTIFILHFIVLLFCVQTLLSQTAMVGPQNGALFMVGGAWQNDKIQKEFNRLIGGYYAKLVLIPTASRDLDMENRRNYWLDQGYQNVEIIHAQTASEADSETFTKVLENANAVWFYGGDPSKLAATYLSTNAYGAFLDVLDRGGVIGGVSAGAMIQGQYDAFGIHQSEDGEPLDNYGTFFSLVSDIAVVPHIRARDYWDVLNVGVRRFPEVLGLGLPNGAGVIITQDTLRVIGNSIAVYDGKNTSNCTPAQCYKMYSPGTNYNIFTRSEIQPEHSNSIKLVGEELIQIKYSASTREIELSTKNDFSSSGNLDVISMSGKKCISKNIHFKDGEMVDVGQLSPGVYIIACCSDRFRITEKILVY